MFFLEGFSSSDAIDSLVLPDILSYTFLSSLEENDPYFLKLAPCPGV